MLADYRVFNLYHLSNGVSLLMLKADQQYVAVGNCLYVKVRLSLLLFILSN